MFGVKFLFGKEVRRVEVEDTTSYEELRETALRIFKRGLPTEFVLKYLDDEGDLITCTSDEELYQAFLLFQDKKLLKMHILSTEKRNLLDTLEDALTKFLKDNPATALWELIKAKVENSTNKERRSHIDANEAGEFGSEEKSSPISVENSLLNPELEALSASDIKTEEIESESDSSFSEDESSLSSSCVANSQTSEEIQSERSSQQFTVQEEISQFENPQENTVSSVSISLQTEKALSASEISPMLCSRIVSKLEQLEDMGFNNKEKNTEYLIKHNGDMLETVKSLLEHF